MAGRSVCAVPLAGPGGRRPVRSSNLLSLLADDHSRVLLKSENSHSNSDYINASPIVSTCPGPTRLQSRAPTVSAGDESASGLS